MFMYLLSLIGVISLVDVLVFKGFIGSYLSSMLPWNK